MYHTLTDCVKPGTHSQQGWSHHGRLCWKSTKLWPHTHGDKIERTFNIWGKSWLYRQQCWNFMNINEHLFAGYPSAFYCTLNTHYRIVSAYYALGRQPRCQEDPVSLPSGRLEKTTRSPPHHVAQHRPTGSETPSYAPRSSRFGSEPPSVEEMLTYGATQS